MSNARHDTPTLDQLVLRWIKALPRGGPNVRQAFAQFVRTSPEHLKVYLTHKALDTEFKALDPQRRIDVAAYIARARNRGNVIPWDGPERGPLRGSEISQSGGDKRPVMISTLLFALGISSIVVGALFMQWQSTCRNTYVTDVGQWRRIELPDGSQLQLNTHSIVAVKFTPMLREVRLVDGEVMFTVHHDRRRPFRVRVGHQLIEDLGTQFNVRVSAAGTLITVVEGQVNVVDTTEILQRLGSPRGGGLARHSVATNWNSAVNLRRYDEALISADAGASRPRISRLSAQEMAMRVSWTRGVVTLNGQTLVEAVAEMNRYNPLRLEVVDPNIAGLRLGGTFDPTDPLSFVATLEHLGVKSDATPLAGKPFGTIHLSGSAGPNRMSGPAQ